MLQMNSQELLNEENGQAGNWMKRNPEVICLNETVKAAAELLHNLAADFLPVVGESMNPVGIITSKAIPKRIWMGETKRRLRIIYHRRIFRLFEPMSSSSTFIKCRILTFLQLMRSSS